MELRVLPVCARAKTLHAPPPHIALGEWQGAGSFPKTVRIPPPPPVRVVVDACRRPLSNAHPCFALSGPTSHPALPHIGRVLWHEPVVYHCPWAWGSPSVVPPLCLVKWVSQSNTTPVRAVFFFFFFPAVRVDPPVGPTPPTGVRGICPNPPPAGKFFLDRTGTRYRGPRPNGLGKKGTADTTPNGLFVARTVLRLPIKLGRLRARFDDHFGHSMGAGLLQRDSKTLTGSRCYPTAGLGGGIVEPGGGGPS